MLLKIPPLNTSVPEVVSNSFLVLNLSVEASYCNNAPSFRDEESTSESPLNLLTFVILTLVLGT